MVEHFQVLVADATIDGVHGFHREVGHHLDALDLGNLAHPENVRATLRRRAIDAYVNVAEAIHVNVGTGRYTLTSYTYVLVDLPILFPIRISPHGTSRTWEVEDRSLCNEIAVGVDRGLAVFVDDGYAVPPHHLAFRKPVKSAVSSDASHVRSGRGIVYMPYDVQSAGKRTRPCI